jgi:hypothetical protein
MNCSSEVPQEDGKFFAEVFVCSDCYLIAARVYEKAQKDTRNMLVMMKEAIRLSIIRKELQFKTLQEVVEAPSSEILSQMAKWTEDVREQAEKSSIIISEPCDKTPSTESTKQLAAALTAPGSVSSSSPTPAGSK